MELSITRFAGKKDLERHNGDINALIEELVAKVRQDISARVETLVDLLESHPDSGVYITSRYNTDKPKPEPSDENRAQLFALATLQARFMERARCETEFDKIALFAMINNEITGMMKEIESD